MKSKFILTGIFALVAIWLFVSAPPELPDGIGNRNTGNKIPIETVFKILSEDNHWHRTLYTRGVVGPGLKAGLKFDEKWENPQVDAGPLPALFLRSTAMELEKSGKQLGLFLGSDFPIESSNSFNEMQLGRFQLIRENGLPQFFYDSTVGRHTAMFADIAVAEPCVSCHNEHPNSPKKDWKLGDVMGATTWNFPDDSISIDRLLELLKAYRQSARTTYERYEKKCRSFATGPVTSTNQWPSSNEKAIPSTATFCDSVYTLSSPVIMKFLINP